MGGASSWHLAVHHPGDWCTVNPGAGFVETARYADVFKAGKPFVPWWEQVLWRWYDADIAAANLYNVPVVAYSGEKDKQKAAADTMVAAASAEGIEIPHVIGPNTEHKYEPAARKLVAEKIDALAEKGSVAVPSKIRFVTYGLRYHRMKWLELDALDRHWERAKVDAEIVDEGTIRIATQNVAALTLSLKSDPLPLDKTQPPRVIIDGDHLVGPAVTAPWIASFHREANGWKPGPATPTGLRKQHGLSGPIDDAFMDRFIFVRPSNPGFHPSTDQWVSSELTRATAEWRRVFRGEALVKDDRNISEQDIADANLVLWGDPASNAVLARILDRLPLQWNKMTLAFGTYRLSAAHHVPVFIFPNPLNPRRYIVVNSSFTFRMGSRTSNSLQTPKLPDWALIDLRTPPSDVAPGLIYDAGFFDERWQIQLNQP
jgi:hypothetical protein